MEIKTVYGYDSDGKYKDTLTLDDTDRSPRSRAWNIPAGYTEEAPPPARENYDIYWTGTTWEYREIPQPEKEPEPTLEELKERKIAELKGIRNAREIEPIEYGVHKFDYDADSRDRIRLARQKMERSGISFIQWTTADNQEINVTAEDLANIDDEAATRSNELHIKYRELKARVNDAKTKEEIGAVAW